MGQVHQGGKAGFLCEGLAVEYFAHCIGKEIGIQSRRDHATDAKGVAASRDYGVGVWRNNENLCGWTKGSITIDSRKLGQILSGEHKCYDLRVGVIGARRHLVEIQGFNSHQAVE